MQVVAPNLSQVRLVVQPAAQQLYFPVVSDQPHSPSPLRGNQGIGSTHAPVAYPPQEPVSCDDASEIYGQVLTDLILNQLLPSSEAWKYRKRMRNVPFYRRWMKFQAPIYDGDHFPEWFHKPSNAFYKDKADKLKSKYKSMEEEFYSWTGLNPGLGLDWT